MIKEPTVKQYTQHGKLYTMEYKHRANMWAKYKIRYTIDNTKYNMKTYIKQ